jgi:hypothetical protein
MDGTQAEFAGAAHGAARHQLIAANAFGAAEQCPGIIGHVFRFGQIAGFIGAIGQMLVAHRQRGGDGAEIEAAEVCGAGCEAALVDQWLQLFWAFQPAAGNLQRPVCCRIP